MIHHINNVINRKVKFVVLCLFMLACEKSGNRQSEELIQDADKQNIIFSNLLQITNNSISENIWNDSLAFLILPVQASCPSCRNKTIDSIVKYRDKMQDNHYIIISADGGRKTISSFFKENNKDLPIIDNRLFLDSTNQAYKFDLYDKKPTIYYTYNRKAFKKVAAIPATVKEDLHEFFCRQTN